MNPSDSPLSRAAPDDALRAGKAALRVQAAAVAAQQAALTEEEDRLEQQRATLQQQEAQLATHLEQKETRLQKLTEKTLAGHSALKQERVAFQEQATRTSKDLEQAQRQLLADQQQIKKEREQLADRLRQWEREREKLEADRLALHESRLRDNGERELARRQLADEQRQWKERRTREQGELKKLHQQLDARTGHLADAERRFEDERYQWERRRVSLHQETEGLERRIANQRLKLQEQQRQIDACAEDFPGDQAATQAPAQHVVPLATESNPQLDQRLEVLDCLAETLADQRMRLVERWQVLAEAQQRWEAEHEQLTRQMEAVVAELPAREQALLVTEADLLGQQCQLLRLRHDAEALAARLRTREAAWEGEKDRLLADLAGREEIVVNQLAALVDLRQTWATRRRQELDLVRSERAACDKLRRELSAMRQQWSERSAPDGDVGALVELRQALQMETARQEERRAALQKLADELQAREIELAQKQAAWDQSYAETNFEQAKLRHNLETLCLQRERYEQQLAQHQEEVDRLARLLMDSPQEALPSAKAA